MFAKFLQPDAAPALKANDVIGFLDIGASKISCFIVRVIRDESFRLTAEIIGAGHHVSEGVATNGLIERAADEAIRHAISKAETMAGVSLESVTAAITARHIRTCRVSVTMPMNGAQILRDDIAQCDCEARRLVKGAGEVEVLHLVGAGFELDGRGGFSDPVGLSCGELTQNSVALTAPAPILRNFREAMTRQGLSVSQFVAAPFAAALSVLQPEEQQIGALNIDMGARSSGFTVFRDGKLVHCGHVPLGGAHVTRDIALALGISLAQAERLKVMQGTGFCAPGDDSRLIDIPAADGKASEETVSVMALADIIGPRLQETLSLLFDRLEQAGVDKRLVRRAVITGGGAQARGLCDLVERVHGIRARPARPLNNYNAPEHLGGAGFAVSLGMIDATLAEGRLAGGNADRPLPEGPVVHNPLFRAAHWLRAHF